MKFVKSHWWSLLLLIATAFIFFYKTIFRGLLPFPGDLLLSEYNPWRHASYGGYAPGAVPSKVQYFDVIRELYPWKWLAIDEIRNGRLPLWNPYSFSGTPLFANAQSAVLYPLNILYAALPFDTAWSVLIILQPILGSLFFYLFATTIGVSAWGAVLGAIAFNYGSFANVWIEFNTVWHTILWLPLMLWCIEKRKTVPLAFSVFASATAGHPQDFLYVFGFSLVYAIARVFRGHHFATSGGEGRVFGGFFAGLGMASAQLLPTIELFRVSARVAHDYSFIVEKMLIPPWQLIKIVVPDFFGNPATKTYALQDTYVNATLSVGLVSILFALVSVLSRSASWHRKFFLWMAGGVLLLTVRTPITELFYRVPIPILSTGSPTRMLSLFAISLAVLSGLGMDTALKHRELFLRAAAGIGLVLATGWIGAVKLSSAPTMRAMALGTVLFTAGSTAMLVAPNKWRVPAMISILTMELFLAFLKFNPFVPRSFIYPPHPLWMFLRSLDPLDRFWGYGTAAIPANVSILYRIQSPDGTDPLNVKRYNQFVQSSHHGMLARQFTRATRSDAVIAPGYGEEDLGKNLARLRILDALGVRYIIDRAENAATAVTFPPERFSPVWKEDGWTVFENIKAAPRYFLTHEAIPYQSMEEFENVLFSPTFSPSRSVLVPSTLQLPTLKDDPSKRIKLIRYEPTRVMFETETHSMQLLYLSDADDGNWRASLDGKNVPIIQANWAFRAVLVPPGVHTVVFWYLPPSLSVGVLLSIASILGTTATILLKMSAHFISSPPPCHPEKLSRIRGRSLARTVSPLGQTLADRSLS